MACWISTEAAPVGALVLLALAVIFLYVVNA
jgi:hypothetical protein